MSFTSPIGVPRANRCRDDGRHVLPRHRRQQVRPDGLGPPRPARPTIPKSSSPIRPSGVLRRRRDDPQVAGVRVPVEQPVGEHLLAGTRGPPSRRSPPGPSPRARRVAGSSAGSPSSHAGRQHRLGGEVVPHGRGPAGRAEFSPNSRATSAALAFASRVKSTSRLDRPREVPHQPRPGRTPEVPAAGVRSARPDRTLRTHVPLAPPPWPPRGGGPSPPTPPRRAPPPGGPAPATRRRRERGRTPGTTRRTGLPEGGLDGRPRFRRGTGTAGPSPAAWPVPRRSVPPAARPAACWRPARTSRTSDRGLPRRGGAARRWSFRGPVRGPAARTAPADRGSGTAAGANLRTASPNPWRTSTCTISRPRLRFSSSRTGRGVTHGVYAPQRPNRRGLPRLQPNHHRPPRRNSPRRFPPQHPPPTSRPRCLETSTHDAP